MGKKQINIQPYIGYGNTNKIYCYGRILKKRFLYTHKELSKWYNLINAIKRLESDELPYCKFYYKIGNTVKEGKTNSEGFYYIQDELPIESVDKSSQPIYITLKKEDIDATAYNNETDIVAQGEILFAKQNASFAIISDIDDTILHTEVMSKFKWRVIYNSLFIGPKARKTINGTCSWYQQLHAFKNPFFYISNSPWNLYDYLQQFLQSNHFPEGPILLRDFGKKKKDALQDYSNHKRNEIEKMILAYPLLQFVLIGDGGEKDADIYLEIYKKHPQRIKAIFIHRLGNAKHQARIEQLVLGNETFFFFIYNTNEAMQISKSLGLI